MTGAESLFMKLRQKVCQTGAEAFKKLQMEEILHQLVGTI